MLHPNQITIGVVFTFSRDINLSNFFTTCLKDELTKECKFVIIDNCCTFNIKEQVEKYLKPEQYKIVRNQKIESLPFNHNLIYFNAETEYVIHNNDEVYFLPNWLKSVIDWVNDNNHQGLNKLAHLCRCSKGYYKHTLTRMGYFNLDLQGKEQSDSEIEFRELKYLEGSSISVEEFRHKDAENYLSKVIGGKWDLVFFKPLQSMCYIAKCCIQPADPAHRMNDSNRWLPGNENLSERNLTPERDNWHLIDSQSLTDISHLFT